MRIIGTLFPGHIITSFRNAFALRSVWAFIRCMRCLAEIRYRRHRYRLVVLEAWDLVLTYMEISPEPAKEWEELYQPTRTIVLAKRQKLIISRCKLSISKRPKPKLMFLGQRRKGILDRLDLRQHMEIPLLHHREPTSVLRRQVMSLRALETRRRSR